MRQVVVIPDLHGRVDLLKAVVDHYPNAHFLGLGDAIDRGPRSLPTIEMLMSLHAESRATLLMGNHERMAQEGLRWYKDYLGTHDMGDYRRAMEGYQWWMRAGGETVRRELGGLTLEQFPPQLAKYLGMPELKRVVYVTADGQIHDEAPGADQPSVLVSHAAPPVAHQSHPNPMSAALWLRPFEGPFPLAPGVVYSLHGHTPIRQPTRLGNHVYIDLGAYETGRLAVVEIGNPSDRPVIRVFQGRGAPEVSRKYMHFGEPMSVSEEIMVRSSESRPGPSSSPW